MVRVGVSTQGNYALAVVNRSDIVDGSKGSCPPVQHATLLLLSLPPRVKLFENNNATLASRTGRPLGYFRAIDGLDREAALQVWRALGIRFHNNHKAARRSFGQFACTLTKLQAFAWQVRHRVPFLLQLEDDIAVDKPVLYQKLACYASTFLRPGSKYSLVRFLSYGEAYLTSLEGARRILRHYCTVGIRNNADFELASSGLTLSMYVFKLGIFRLLAVSGRGHIRRTGHLLNDTELRRVSHSWPRPAWCNDDGAFAALPAPPLLHEVNWSLVVKLNESSKAEAKAVYEAELLAAERKARLKRGHPDGTRS